MGEPARIWSRVRPIVIWGLISTLSVVAFLSVNLNGRESLHAAAVPPGAAASSVAREPAPEATTPYRIAAPTVASPPAQPVGEACRVNAFAHVHDPQRLVPLQDCIAIAGSVVDVWFVPAFGDFKMRISPDDPESLFGDEAIQQTFVAAVIPTDQPRIFIPPVGAHATFHGAWVKLIDGGALELHPTWWIEPDEPALDQVRLPVEDLTPVVRVVDTSMAVGERIDPLIRVVAPRGRNVLERQVRLFVELATASGRGVAWKAAQTNTLGSAAIDLVALQLPGEYELTVYARKGAHFGVTTVPVTIRRS